MTRSDFTKLCERIVVATQKIEKFKNDDKIDLWEKLRLIPDAISIFDILPKHKDDAKNFYRPGDYVHIPEFEVKGFKVTRRLMREVDEMIAGLAYGLSSVVEILKQNRIES